jgi:hypothetical protein
MIGESQLPDVHGFVREFDRDIEKPRELRTGGGATP